MPRKHHCLILLLLLAMLSCSRRTDTFADIDSRLDGEAADMLLRLDSLGASDMSEDDRARHILLTAKALYRLCIKPAGDSVLHNAAMHLANRGYCDSITAYGLYLDGMGMVNSGHVTDGMAALHRAYSMGVELGNHRLAGLSARELSTSLENIRFFNESREWARTAKDEFIKAGRPTAASELDALIIETTYWLDEDAEALAMCADVDTALMRDTRLSYPFTILRTKADALFDLKRYDEALAVLDTIEALKIDTGAYHWNSRAEVLIAMGRTDEAVSALDKAAATMYKPSDSAYYYDNVTDLMAAQGDYKTAYRRMKDIEEEDDASMAKDKLLYPGNALINYYSSREQAQRHNAALTRTVAVLAWCVAALLAVVLAVVCVVFVRRHRRRRAEHERLEATIAELKHYINDSGFDPERPDDVPDNFNIDTVNNLCTTLFIIGTLPLTGANDKTRNGRKLAEITEFYSGDTFIKGIEDIVDSRRHRWVSLFRNRYPDCGEQNVALATLLYLGLSTEAIAFITGSKSLDSIYTKKSRLKEIINSRPEYASEYLPDLGMA